MLEDNIKMEWVLSTVCTMYLTNRHDCLVFFNVILTVIDVVILMVVVVVVPQGNKFKDIHEYSSMGLLHVHCVIGRMSFLNVISLAVLNRFQLMCYWGLPEHLSIFNFGLFQ